MMKTYFPGKNHTTLPPLTHSLPRLTPVSQRHATHISTLKDRVNDWHSVYIQLIGKLENLYSKFLGKRVSSCEDLFTDIESIYVVTYRHLSFFNWL